MLAANQKKIYSWKFFVCNKQEGKDTLNKFQQVERSMLAYSTQRSLKKVDEKKKHYGSENSSVVLRNARLVTVCWEAWPPVSSTTPDNLKMWNVQMCL